jgi:hypothetical protein
MRRRLECAPDYSINRTDTMHRSHSAEVSGNGCQREEYRAWWRAPKGASKSECVDHYAFRLLPSVPDSREGMVTYHLCNTVAYRHLYNAVTDRYLRNTTTNPHMCNTAARPHLYNAAAPPHLFKTTANDHLFKTTTCPHLRNATAHAYLFNSEGLDTFALHGINCIKVTSADGSGAGACLRAGSKHEQAISNRRIHIHSQC